jgi:UDP-glucose:(heptosyl)LPS alpha-1,3-glucosyltransferase
VRFAGVRRDVERVYAACDAFVLPTAYETFSLVTYEAAAAGVPIVATRVSGIEDLLRDGENGVEITRDAASIAAALRRLDDPAERERMGAAGRATVERRPTARAIAAAYAELYAGA